VLSATSYVRLLKQELSVWDLVRPMPERPTAGRRIGTEVHKRIEERSRGLSPFADEAELDQPSEVWPSSRVGAMLARFEELYSERKIARLPSGEPMVEIPFTLRKDGTVVRGRIDAVYEGGDGALEIVDFKTGKAFAPGDTAADQLELYAEALRALGLVSSERVTLTYAFLDEEEPTG
jgi:DNA helicase-2/ATP-dependent DNA helicase PcrA